MKRILLSSVFITCFLFHVSADPTPILTTLLHEINQSQSYDLAKVNRIEKLKESLHTVSNKSFVDQFNLIAQIYDEYKVFDYDSAYRYAGKLQHIAFASNNPVLINDARLKYVFIMISAGLYRETYDTLASINPATYSNENKAIYYTLIARYYSDLAAYENDKYHSANYDSTASHYMDSAIHYYPQNSFEKEYYTGWQLFKQNKPDESIIFLEKVLSNTNLSDHELAVTASTLASVYLLKGKTDKSINLFARSAIADIRTSTKETFAIFNLAELLYKLGDEKEAAFCIEKAIADAEFYNARLRKAQISGIYKLIESERLQAIESQRRLAIHYGMAVTFFLVILAILIVLIRKQINKLHDAKRIITEAHKTQQQINAKLEDANKIKEEYIGYFFKLDSEYFGRLEKLKNTIKKKLIDRKSEDIHFILNNIKPLKEKKELLSNFDKVFLRIFPNFINSFNALFKEEDQIKLDPDELLNTDLRVFALIRIGISENEKIAEILDYSINTISAYKTRIKNKSIIPNDDFEKKIMEIKSM